ncbi:hypothetical protein B1NLA3E_11065 [Bacillus sp. 1NLA3E]|nr:hypothetical protein B1NLA3E_11065 [Bacillus sp. 1NLA3E]
MDLIYYIGIENSRGWLLMKNLANTKAVLAGKIYMIEIQDGKLDSFRVLTETPTHYIFSVSSDESVEVFEMAKKDIVGIYEVKDWVNAHPE